MTERRRPLKKLKGIVLTRFKIIVTLFLYIVIVITIGSYTFLSLILQFLKNTRSII